MGARLHEQPRGGDDERARGGRRGEACEEVELGDADLRKRSEC